MQNEIRKLYHSLQPGTPIKGDWCNFPVPQNMIVGENTVFDSSFTFKNFYSELPVGIRIGNNVTIRTTRLSAEPNAYIEIGDYCFLSNASIACYNKIIIGNYVYIAGGVNIVDTDFHPLSPAARLADTIALSPAGNKVMRPGFATEPVIIGDDVWIGFNATILKGVTIGKGAIIQPGAVIVNDVPECVVVAGNPAKIMEDKYVGQ